jgi:hypothetical protein
MSRRSALTPALDVLIASVLMHSCARDGQVAAPQLYEIVTETTMPHLEENLRYATTREQRCLEQDKLWSAFPILHHPALKDCRLDQESRQQDASSYALVCEGRHGTTGRATWELGRKQITGTLDVKLGGKNMTFYQRITARPLSECSHYRSIAPDSATPRSVAGERDAPR